ncbi:uncharacterized protein [Maniola hyperantus]|uniref:uncharacterized protein n=1 Tax=Aphantopus hyperantus TaxID=2795564 RepID=UPI0021239D18
MPPTRKVSARQYELLIKFADTHRDIALGRYTGGSLGSQAAKLAWQTVTTQLNAVEVGVRKTAAQWRRYWIELKAKVKSKAADSRRMARGTGGGPTRLLPLTPAEKKILTLLGPVAVKGLRGVPTPFKVSVRTLSSMREEGEEDSSSVDLTPISGRPSVERENERDSTGASPEASGLQVNPLEEDQASQPEDWAILTVEDQATQWEDDVVSQSTRSSQNIVQDVDVRLPSWALQLESRWLDMEERNTAALTRIADALHSQTAALQRVADGITQIVRFMTDPGT